MNLLLFIMSLASALSTTLLQERLLFGALARTDLIQFSRLTSPDPGDLFNPRKSRFEAKRHHVYLARHLQLVREGKINRFECEMPPRHGKSELSVRKFVPWFAGWFPDRSIIVVTHTDQLAREHGRDCRDVFRSPGYKITFGDERCQLREESQASDRMQLVGGGVITFSGRGGLGAGVGAHLMVFDDFFKNSEEATSPTVREHAFNTYVSDCQSRLNNDQAPIVMIGTRRNEDDVQGRLFDPTNVHYDEREAKRWYRIRLPGLAEEKDALGRKPGEALWPERFSAQYYLSRKNHASEIIRLDHEVQDQCNPSPAEGTWFKADWLKTYRLEQLPRYLRIYCASDHAYRKGQKNDLTCLLVVGIDPSGIVYVLADTWWKKAETDEIVDQMLYLMKGRKPEQWWAARDAISGSIGPFLKKRMRDEKVFVPLDDDIVEDVDLVRRTTSIRGLMSMGMVYWPSWAPWWPEARRQLLTFPGQHDDLVAALGVLGMGMDKMLKARGGKVSNQPKPGTFAALSQRSALSAEEEAIKKHTAGW